MKKIYLLVDCPSQMEIQNSGLTRGGAWNEFFSLMTEVGFPRSQVEVLYLTYQNISEQEYHDSTLKKARPTTTLYQGRLFPAKVIQKIEAFLSKVNNIPKGSLIFCLGDLCLDLLVQERSCATWRGSIFNFNECILLPTYDPNLLLAKPEWRYFTRADLARGFRYWFNGSNLEQPVFDFRTISTLEELIAWKNLHAEAIRKKLCVDIETFGKSISCIGLSISKEHAIRIPFGNVVNGTAENYLRTLEEEFEIVEVIKEILWSSKHLFGQNFLYDLTYMFHSWLFFPKEDQEITDTMLMAHLLEPAVEKSLDVLASVHLPYYQYWKDSAGDDGVPKNLKYAGGQNLWHYNSLDCANTYGIHEVLYDRIRQSNLEEQHLYQSLAIIPLLRMSCRGVRIDESTLLDISRTLSTHRSAAYNFVQTVTGRELNVNSPKQLCEYFYEELGLPEQHHPKRKNVTCDEDAMENLARMEPIVAPIAKRINYIRSLGTKIAVCNTPRSSLGRWHTSYNPGGTVTFRLSSSEPVLDDGTNLQNITKGDDSPQQEIYSPNIRRVVIPDPDYILFEGDLERADLQVVVWESDDRELKDRLRAGVDLHKANAMDIFGISCMENVNDKQRQLAKMGVHAVNYDVYPRTLATALGITVKEAEHFKKRWLDAHPGVLEWQNRVHSIFQATRKVWNKFGYYWKFHGRIDHHSLHESLAWCPQSTVALVTQRIMLNIERNLPLDHVNTLLQVHDSLAFQVHKDYVDKYLRQISESKYEFIPPGIARIPIPYDDVLYIPFEIKRKKESWGV